MADVNSAYISTNGKDEKGTKSLNTLFVNLLTKAEDTTSYADSDVKENTHLNWTNNSKSLILVIVELSPTFILKTFSMASTVSSCNASLVFRVRLINVRRIVFK